MEDYCWWGLDFHCSGKRGEGSSTFVAGGGKKDGKEDTIGPGKIPLLLIPEEVYPEKKGGKRGKRKSRPPPRSGKHKHYRWQFFSFLEERGGGERYAEKLLRHKEEATCPEERAGRPITEKTTSRFTERAKRARRKRPNRKIKEKPSRRKAHQYEPYRRPEPNTPRRQAKEEKPKEKAVRQPSGEQAETRCHYLQKEIGDFRYKREVTTST